MMRKLSAMLVAMLATMSLSAQIVTWQIKPGKYDDISRYGSDMFRVKKNGRFALIRHDGSEVTPLFDRFAGYYGGFALILANEAVGSRIMGVLTEDGDFMPFEDKYYTMPGMEFVSDGLIPVRNGRGQLCYVDIYGRKPFDLPGNIGLIAPFTEGYATVQLQNSNNRRLIDKQGQPVQFSLPTVGSVVGNCNPYRGRVYVYDNNKKYYVYDINRRGQCVKADKPNDKEGYDYLLRYRSVTHQPAEVPYTDIQDKGRTGLNPQRKGSYYGFVDGGNVIMPYQFTDATPFIDNLSIVEFQGRKGVLKLVNGPTFTLSAPKAEVKYHPNKDVECTFNVKIPQAWAANSDVQLTNAATGRIDIESRGNGTYAFSLIPTEKGTQTFNVTVYSDGLKLYEGSFDMSFKPIIKCKTCGQDIEVCPYKGAHPVQTTEPKHDNTPKEKRCPTCDLPISKCPFQGVH